MSRGLRDGAGAWTTACFLEDGLQDASSLWGDFATRETHTESRIYALVKAEGGSERALCLTQPLTGSILGQNDCSRMSGETKATGRRPCKASKPR